jgi:hypothetical protein
MRGNQSLGFFWEIYNATNHINYQNPTGVRTSSQFMIPVVAGDMRTLQLGVRYQFSLYRAVVGVQTTALPFDSA